MARGRLGEREMRIKSPAVTFPHKAVRRLHGRRLKERRSIGLIMSKPVGDAENGYSYDVLLNSSQIKQPGTRVLSSVLISCLMERKGFGERRRILPKGSETGRYWGTERRPQSCG